MMQNPVRQIASRKEGKAACRQEARRAVARHVWGRRIAAGTAAGRSRAGRTWADDWSTWHRSRQIFNGCDRQSHGHLMVSFASNVTITATLSTLILWAQQMNKPKMSRTPNHQHDYPVHTLELGHSVPTARKSHDHNRIKLILVSNLTAHHQER